jgi:hypothetical protein
MKVLLFGACAATVGYAIGRNSEAIIDWINNFIDDLDGAAGRLDDFSDDFTAAGSTDGYPA